MQAVANPSFRGNEKPGTKDAERKRVGKNDDLFFRNEK